MQETRAHFSDVTQAVWQFASPILDWFLWFFAIASVLWNLASNSATIPNWLVGLLFILALGRVAWGWFRKSEVQASPPASVDVPPAGHRVAIDMQGGTGRFGKTVIRNHDTGFKSQDSDIDSDDLDIR